MDSLNIICITHFVVCHNFHRIRNFTALQANKDVLLSTMDVFVKEPLLNWDSLAMKVAGDKGGPTSLAMNFFVTNKE